MSAPTQQRPTQAAPAAQQPPQQSSDAKALQAALTETEKRLLPIARALESDKCIAAIEEVLPDGMKGQARRLVKRAEITFSEKPDLAACPPDQFKRCVIRAAEVGLAIDGRLCYVVNYRGKASTWQTMPDYKGLIAVAKRAGQITDCYGDVVCEADTFRAYRDGPTSHLVHELPPGFGKRGRVIGAYAIVKLPDDDWRYELMDLDELEKIRKRAPAQKGPWATDPNQMRIKTVIRRALKLYCDDPAFIRAEQMANEEFEVAPPAEPANRAPLLQRITNGHSPAPEPEFTPPTEAEESAPEPPADPAQDVANEAAENEANNAYDEFQERIGNSDKPGDLNEILNEVEKAEFLGPMRQQGLRDLAARRHKEIVQPAQQTAKVKK